MDSVQQCVMNKSNSKKLYRFIRQKKRQSSSLPDDSFQNTAPSTSEPSEAKEPYSAKERKHHQLPPSDKIINSHSRTRTYPFPLSRQQFNSFKATQNSQSDWGRQQEDETETVITREERQTETVIVREEREKARPEMSQKGKKGLIRLRLGHQIHSYQSEELRVKVLKERQAMAIRQKIFESLQVNLLPADIEFG